MLLMSRAVKKEVRKSYILDTYTHKLVRYKKKKISSIDSKEALGPNYLLQDLFLGSGLAVCGNVLISISLNVQVNIVLSFQFYMLA